MQYNRSYLIHDIYKIDDNSSLIMRKINYSDTYGFSKVKKRIISRERRDLMGKKFIISVPVIDNRSYPHLEDFR